jgi:hypothetical protein
MTTIQSKEHSLNGIAGYGIDADPSARPGVPKEQGPSPREGARQPAQQDTIIGITGRRLPGQQLTPVYGTVPAAQRVSADTSGGRPTPFPRI